jgi:hypothetical protein
MSNIIQTRNHFGSSFFIFSPFILMANIKLTSLNPFSSVTPEVTTGSRISYCKNGDLKIHEMDALFSVSLANLCTSEPFVCSCESFFNESAMFILGKNCSEYISLQVMGRSCRFIVSSFLAF